MGQRGESTYREIIDQPESWAEALQVGLSGAAALRSLWGHSGAKQLLFTGCGSAHCLSLTAAALAREQGLSAKAMPASELWLFPTLAGDLGETLLVTISRSGETSETVRAADMFRQRGGKAVVTVGCYPEAALTKICDVTLAVPSAQEVSMVQTRSVTSMLIVCCMLVAALSGEKHGSLHLDILPHLGRRLMHAYGPLAADLAADTLIQRFFFVGSGPRYGLAREAMLKMKEMSLSYSEADHPLELRHGPMCMVNEQSLAIGLLSDQARAQEEAVLADMRQLGARTLAVTEQGSPVGLREADSGISLGSGLPMAYRLTLYLPVFQLLAYYRAIVNGQDPDRPRNLTTVVTL